MKLKGDPMAKSVNDQLKCFNQELEHDHTMIIKFNKCCRCIVCNVNDLPSQIHSSKKSTKFMPSRKTLDWKHTLIDPVERKKSEIKDSK
jgi:hypothetical protein